MIELVAAEAIGPGARPWTRPTRWRPRRMRQSDRPPSSRFFSGGAWREAAVWRREALALGAEVSGPAIVIEANQTVVVEAGWSARLTAQRTSGAAADRGGGAAPGGDRHSVDPVRLEIFNSLFMSIAEQMGFTLQNTAYSINIKERLDFSCAIFDRRGAVGGQRPAHARAPRVDGRLGRDGDPRQPGPAPRRRLSR